ncbi:hypothetical protein ACLB2K_056096 [Fragaria x ananassa]
MKFGEAFMEYLHNERERYSVLEKCSHVEYKRFKKVLKTCQTCKDEDEAAAVASSRQNKCQSVCDQTFFTELMKEASGISVHCSKNGKHFKSKLRAEHVELLQSPWLIELGAFYLNLEGSDGGEFNELSSHFSCDLDATPPIMALILPDSLKIEYDLTCAICLETVFNPYALSCGHLFCKSCACSAASVYIFQGPKTADSCSKCPICRETGVHAKAVHMLELDLLLKTRSPSDNRPPSDNIKQTLELHSPCLPGSLAYATPPSPYSPSPLPISSDHPPPTSLKLQQQTPAAPKPHFRSGRSQSQSQSQLLLDHSLSTPNQISRAVNLPIPILGSHKQVPQELVNELKAFCKDNMTMDYEERYNHGKPLNSFHKAVNIPDLVVFTRSEEEVCKIVKLCDKHKVPIVPYGGATSIEGHTLSPHGGVCIDMSSMKNVKALHVEDMDVVVEPGIGWMELNEYLEPYGLFFPLDPGPGATIGGMCATRCSGSLAVRYGTMRDNVISLKAVLANGEVVKTASRARKSAAGYDLTRLMIGSEGTLGVITEVTLRLQKIPKYSVVAMCNFPSIKDAADVAITTMLSGIQVRVC